MMGLRAVYLAISLLLFGAIGVNAQTPVGQCNSNMGPFRVFDLNDGSYVFQSIQGYSFQGFRDPTGIVFLGWQLPGQPVQEFVDWNGNVIRIHPGGWAPVGFCQIEFPDRLSLDDVSVPEPGRWGITYENTRGRIPDQFVRHGNTLLPPLIASEDAARHCIQSEGLDKSAFVECLNNSMLSSSQKAAYDCYRENDGDETSFGLCVAKIGMGKNEQKAVDDIQSCYKKHGNDWKQYPTCYFSQSDDPNVARAAQCLQKQAGVNPSFWGFVGCYGAGALGANAELQVAAECAATTGGEPYAFAACTGGRLTAAEIDKCWTSGVGGESGCFGKNNTIVQYLRQLGVDTDSLLNRNGEVIRAFNTVINDLRDGPGPNNDAVRFLNRIGRELEKAGPAGEEIKNRANEYMKRIGVGVRF